ncbi:MAG: ribosomal-processing cysteine protease Prp [Clostridiales bacterium]|nr:ribosomal-processing cysteine protease Prp [Clostridiales bacterium]
MIDAVFYIRNQKTNGFKISGHSDFSEEGPDIVCAAVSSACYMAVNTVTEILGCGIEEDVDDGYMKITLKDANKNAQDIFDGLKLHLSELSKDYPDFIKISTEV